MCMYVWKCRRCACSHNKATTSFRVFWCVDDISVWCAELHSELSDMGGWGPLCGAVTGVNPKLSHQHPHGLLSLKCARTHTSYSLGENGKWRPEAEVGVRWRGKQDAAEEAAFCELSSHYWGFGKALRMTALGTFFFFFFLISLTLFLVNLFSKHVSVWLTREVKSLQTNNMAICSFGIAGFHFFHSFSHHCVVMTDCVMVIEPGCGWWGGYQPSQLETPQLLDWLQCLKEDPDEETMSLFHSWVEGWGPHANLQI